MKHLVASIILVMMVISTQAQNIKSDMIGKWEFTKRELFNTQGKPDPDSPTEIAKDSGYKTTYNFKKNEICEYRELGQHEPARVAEFLIKAKGKIVSTSSGYDKYSYSLGNKGAFTNSFINAMASAINSHSNMPGTWDAVLK